MNENKKLIEQKINFVKQLSEILKTAKPNLIQCEYRFTDKKDEFVYVTAKNGYVYEIDVTANSLAAIAFDVFKFCIDK